MSNLIGFTADTLDGPTEHRAPFVITDAGRSHSRRTKQNNDCTVRALAHAAGVSYDRAYDTLAARGRKSHGGYHFPFGTHTGPKSGPITELDIWFDWMNFPAVKGLKRMNCVLFAETYDTGYYVIRGAKHVYACINGTLLDEIEPDPSRCVYGAWHVIRNWS